VQCFNSISMDTHPLDASSPSGYDALFIAGGEGAAAAANDSRTTDWLKRVFQNVQVVQAAGNGTLLLKGADLPSRTWSDWAASADYVRLGSPTFGDWVGVTLDDVSHEMLWIPPGFAHGLCVVSEQADFVYKRTTYFDPDSDAGVRWDDPAIGIEWPALAAGVTAMSAKDLALPLLYEQKSNKLPLFDEACA
jgi:putative intracellular protease/amidase